MDAYEKGIVLRTLQQVQAETDRNTDELKKQLKNDDSRKDDLMKFVIDIFNSFDWILSTIAVKNGIDVEVKVRGAK